MEKQYQLFYRDAGQTRKITLQAFNEDMAKQFFGVLRPDCQIVYITDDAVPMEPDYVDEMIHQQDELLKHLNS